MGVMRCLRDHCFLMDSPNKFGCSLLWSCTLGCGWECMEQEGCPMYGPGMEPPGLHMRDSATGQGRYHLVGRF